MKKLITIIAAIAVSFMIVVPAMADSNAVVEEVLTTVTIDNSDNRVFEATKPMRYFAPSAEMTYPNAPNMLGGATPSYMDRLKIKDILEYDPEGLTLLEAQELRKDSAFQGKRVMVRAKIGKLVKSQRIPADQPIGVFFTKQENMQSLGTITVVSDDKKAISPDVFAEVVVRAHELGGHAIHVKAEGFQRLMLNEGTGVGFTWGGSSMSGAQSTAMNGVLGAGQSWGEAGYFDHPFIVVHVLAPTNLTFKINKNKTAEVLGLFKD